MRLTSSLSGSGGDSCGARSGWHRRSRVERERLQRLALDGLEEFTSRRATERVSGPVVEDLAQLADASVERREIEEGLMPEPRQDPPLRPLHRHLYLRLVAWLVRARRDDYRAVVRGERSAAPLQVGLVLLNAEERQQLMRYSFHADDLETRRPIA